jgi:hypothetical protein
LRWCCGCVVREDALAVPARGGSGRPEPPGLPAAAEQDGRDTNRARALRASERWFSPRREATERAAADQTTAPTLIRPCEERGKYRGVEIEFAFAITISLSNAIKNLRAVAGAPPLALTPLTVLKACA